MGKKSQAQIRREALGLDLEKSVDPALSAKRKTAAYKSHVARGLTPAAAVPALVRQAEGAAVEQRLDAGRMQNLLKKQADKVSSVADARQFLRSISPQLARRLGRIAMGEEADFAPREQLAAMRLALEVAGAVKAEDGGGEDAPLTQRSVGALRQVIAAGELRIQELQAAIAAQAGLDMGSIEAEAVMLD
jgi:hypothetical protein